MGSLVEIFSAVASLDIAFLLNHIETYIFWFFGFYAAGYFFTDGKKAGITAFVYGIIILFTAQFIFELLGFTIYTAIGLFILYLGRLMVLTFLETSKTLKGYIPLGYVLAFFASVTIVSIAGL